MPMQMCSVCRKLLTSRADGVCDTCGKARQLIETSSCMAVLCRIVLDCEADWRLMDRIDFDQRDN